MNVLEAARRDRAIINRSGNGMSIDVTFTSLGDTPITVTVKGSHSKRYLPVEFNGAIMQSRIASVTVTEADLVALSYPVRVNKLVSMKNHICVCSDSAGQINTYNIMEQFPDETLGSITFILNEVDA